MAKTKDLRVQSSTPSSPSAGVVALYANNSGILHIVNSAGTTYQVGGQVVNNIAMLNQTVSTGYAFLRDSVANNGVTGIFYGGTGNQTVATLLGAPASFIPIVGPSGQLWAIPVYVRS